jgi:membrane fusion protein, multidrug efflux system
MNKGERGLGRGLLSVLICLGIMAVVAAVVGVTAWVPSSEAKTETNGASERVPQVSVRVLQSETVEDQLVLTGSVQPWEEVILSSEVRGKIEWKGVEQGDAVSAGQELYRVDTESIRARLMQAEAQYKLALQELDRIERLAKSGAGTAQSLDSAIANRDVADSSLRMLQIEVAKSVVKAPFDGVVDTVLVDQDEFVDIGTPLLRLVQVYKVKIVFGIPERDIAHFKKGDNVRVRMDATPDQTFEGVIHKIATSADMATHTFQVEVAVENPEGLLKPGMIGRGTFVRAVYPDSLMIPLFTAILLDEQRVAFIEKDGIAELRPIQVGLVQGSSVQVTQGLEPGDHLIVKGQYEVRPGEKVDVQEVLE